MQKNKIGRALSRLELAVLGLVSNGQPCTAYWIRRQFQLSPSSFFSGSAGAVYPAMRRLEERSLVTSTTKLEGRRKSQEFRLTDQGRQVLKAWLTPPLPAEDLAFTLDPVRTRVYYLDALSASEQRRFVNECLTQAKRRVTVIKAESDDRQHSGDRFSYLGGLGVLYEAKARVRWLEHLRSALGDEPD